VGFLTLKHIQFSFRIKEGQAFHLWLNNTISDARFKANQLRKALDKLDLTHQKIVLLGEYIFDLFICKNVTPNVKEKFMYIFTNFIIPADAPGFYRQRWAIEVCFKHLKSNGFDLESTLQGEFKIELLFAIINFVYTLCVVRGICEETENPPTLKTFTAENVQKKYKQTSTFKLGCAKTFDIVYGVFDFLKVLLVATDLNISFST
jgi:hypothetical protein